MASTASVVLFAQRSATVAMHMPSSLCCRFLSFNFSPVRVNAGVRSMSSALITRKPPTAVSGSACAVHLKQQLLSAKKFSHQYNTRGIRTTILCGSSTDTTNESEERETSKDSPVSLKDGTWPRFLSKAAIMAPLEGFNRWLAVPSSFLVQLSIGSVYAFSMWNAPLTHNVGVVAASSHDWTLTEVLPVFSTSAIALGFTTFFLGPWAERAGPRFSAVGAAISYSSAFLLSAVAVQTHSIGLLHLSYGVLGGIGWGLGYISPVSTLMRWFPDRRGLATGLGLTAFGAGAMLAAPVIQNLCDLYFVAPEFLGPIANVAVTTDPSTGAMLADTGNGAMKEVVVATAADVARCPGNLSEGVYVAGTGSSGAASAFTTMGCVYGASMLMGAAGNRVPHPDWKPDGWVPPADKDDTGKDDGMISKHSVDYATALKTPQFYFMWIALMGNAVAGMTVLSSAKTMMGDVFAAGLPLVVTGAFTTKYVSSLSAANSVGRLGWSAFSDYLGRKNTYFLFGCGLPVAATIPFITESFAENPSMIALYGVYFGTLAMVSFYGGLFATLPAYLADIFGSHNAGAIHGRVLTAWSGAALVGPNMLGFLRNSSYNNAVADLVQNISPEKFETTFGAPLTDLDKLVQAKTVTIPRLMELMPASVADPTPLLYNSTMFGICGMLSVALLANHLIKPVHPKYWMENQPQYKNAK
eukprot:m.562694 g.562694  ORF g.562694 m.562694 type:complete len:697 (+) comp22224_c0_seq5:226-2316(+)